MKLTSLLPTAAVLTVLTMSSADVIAAPLTVACGPGRQALVRNTVVRGEVVTRVECIGAGYRRSIADPYATAYRPHRRHRSWGKSALIIGGSAASGAGIGGIVDGKKGALIGAALG